MAKNKLSPVEAELHAAHNPALRDNDGSHVFLLWSDGEITMTKGGSLFMQRSMFTVAPAILHPDMMDVKHWFPTYGEHEAEYDRVRNELEPEVPPDPVDHLNPTKEEREAWNRHGDEREKWVKRLTAMSKRSIYIHVTEEDAFRLRELLLDEYVQYVRKLAEIRTRNMDYKAGPAVRTVSEYPE